MKKKSMIIYIILAIGCSPKQENVKIISTPKHIAENLKGESLNMSDTLADPGRIYYYDSLLFLRESVKDVKMIVCDPYKCSIVNELIPHGRGPGEQIGTFYFSYCKETKNIFAIDVTLRKMLVVNKDSVYLPDYHPIQSHNFPVESVLNLSAINDTSFITLGYFDDCRAQKFTLSGKIEKIGDSPDIHRSINPIINEAYTGVMKISPKKDKFVIACRYADQLEIFDLNSQKQSYIKGPELFEPRYSVKKMNGYTALAHKDDEIFGYTDLCVSNDQIFALYSGKLTSLENGIYCNIIRVFSWDGEYLQDYILDKEIRSLGFNEQEGIFYGIATEPGAEIYKFKIK